MKLYFVLLLLLGLATSNATTAQITAPVDSIAPLLCKTWRVSYALADNMRIDMKPGVKTPDFGFNTDKTFWIAPFADGSRTKGTWVYDSASKTIKMIINKKGHGTIIQLQADQLIILFDTKEATPDDPTPIKVVYKVKVN
jgi:hypothetical protein